VELLEAANFEGEKRELLCVHPQQVITQEAQICTQNCVVPMENSQLLLHYRGIILQNTHKANNEMEESFIEWKVELLEKRCYCS